MTTTIKSKGRVVQPRENREKVTISLPPSLLALVDAEAEANMVSRSAVIVVALREHFRQGE
jgi:metal-responsive CopG/Arc/MetJ family transcriptional regulator